jgi:hypothetical protein
VLATVITIAATIPVYLYVRKTTRAITLPSYQHASLSTSSPKNKQLKEVAWQTMLYLFAYLNGTLWTIVWWVVLNFSSAQGREHEPRFYALSVLTYWFYPLQGFWNSYIYIRPRYKSWRKVDSDATTLAIFKKIFSKEEPIVLLRRSAIPNLGTGRRRAWSGDSADSAWQDQSDLVGPLVSLRNSVRNQFVKRYFSKTSQSL